MFVHTVTLNGKNSFTGYPLNPSVLFSSLNPSELFSCNVGGVINCGFPLNPSVLFSYDVRGDSGGHGTPSLPGGCDQFGNKSRDEITLMYLLIVFDLLIVID